jgi:hypothetical protein
MKFPYIKKQILFVNYSQPFIFHEGLVLFEKEFGV